MAIQKVSVRRERIKRLAVAGEKNPNWRGGKPVPCLNCKAKVWVCPYRQTGFNYCSRKCHLAHVKAHGFGERSGRWAGGPEQRECPVCRETFAAHRREVTRGGAKYCSPGCAKMGRRTRVSLTCEVCKAPFEAALHKKDTARFCSRPCKKQSQVKVRTPEEIACRKIHSSMASMIGAALKGTKGGRRWETLVGYTTKELMRHLESQFLPGMTWENRGRWGWHVEHIRPRCSFAFTSTDDPEFLECWGLANLRPLWWQDNLRKGSKYTPA